MKKRTIILTLLLAVCCLLPSALKAQLMQQLVIYNQDTVYSTNLTIHDSFTFGGTTLFKHLRNGVELGVFPIFSLDRIIFKRYFVPFHEDGIRINGATWATSNVDRPGLFSSRPENPGWFYQWNRKIGWSCTDPLINSQGETLWDFSMPTGNSWEQVNNPCPAGWNVPTLEEWRSLMNAGSFWGELKGVSGRFFGSGEQRLFLPAAGFRVSDGGLLLYEGESGEFWSNSRSPFGDTKAVSLSFIDNSISFIIAGVDLRNALSVRCVKDFDPAEYDAGVVIAGVKWATRNVASHGKFAATPDAHGALFQWGRKGDGHEQRNSPNYPTNNNVAENGVVSGSGNFDANGQIANTCAAYGKYIKQNTTPFDWRDPQISTLWYSGSETAPKKTANDPCPPGWRVPTKTEMDALRILSDWNWNSDRKGYDIGGNLLFLPAAGARSQINGQVDLVGQYGYYWCCTSDDSRARHLGFEEEIVFENYARRTSGFSVRCVSEY
jgi:uncharacterized protein (TIGR02145 family)